MLTEKKSSHMLSANEVNRHRWLLTLLPFYCIVLLFTTLVSTNDFMQSLSRSSIGDAYDALKGTTDFQVIIFSLTMMCVFRSYFIVSDFVRHKKVMGFDRSISYLLTFPAALIFSFFVFLTFSGLVGVVLYFVFDIDLKEAIFLLLSLPAYALAYVAEVPTLVELPKPLAITVIFLVWTFLVYVFHRLCHESRILWLLSHRLHHISTSLSEFTGMGADEDFVLGFVLKFLRMAIPMLLSKLIYPEPLIVEFVVILCIWSCFDSLSHQVTYYETIMAEKTLPMKVLKKCHQFFNTGPYHVLHHSSLPEHHNVNLCGHFCLWDRLFGTQWEPPKQVPPTGLTNQPKIYLTPHRLIFSGILQILYELKNNKGLAIKFKILFGSINYIPPVSKSFLKTDKTTVNHVDHFAK